jgi:uncharacterized protein YbjT (DUF2867 family)
MATALILGPTGLVGSYLLPLLIEAPEYERVIALSRRPLELRHPKLTVVLSELAQVGLRAQELQADDLYSCLGTTIKVAKTQEAFLAVDHQAPLEVAALQAQRHRKRLALVSSLGADLGSAFFYSRAKAQTERELAALGFERLYVARPSLLLGQRREARLGEKLGELGALPLSPIMRGKEPREGMEWAVMLGQEARPLPVG